MRCNMIRPEQLKQINALVDQYRKDLRRATEAENRLQEDNLKELATEYATMRCYETDNEYVKRLVNQRAVDLKDELDKKGLGTNGLHQIYVFGFAKNENELIGEVMHAQARTGLPVYIRCNPDYFFEYISNTFDSAGLGVEGVVFAGFPIEFDESIYSYIIEFREEN